MAKKVSATAFAQFLTERAKAKDGYIMGSKGERPKSWSKTSWWFTQYTGSQRTKALYWREHAERVWDCNGMAEGYYEDQTKVNINTRARNNYSEWCGTKGTGRIPAKHRKPGAAVFVYSASEGYITHVGFLTEPVDPKNPAGDWWLVEARGVMYGVVRYKYSQRTGYNRWGLMTKYFDYSEALPEPVQYQLGERELTLGCEGRDVKELQTILIGWNYDLGKWGADGEFGACTKSAVMALQVRCGLLGTGVYDAATHEALVALLNPVVDDEGTGAQDDHEDQASDDPGTADEPDRDVDTEKYVKVTGSTVNVRTQPDTKGAIVAVVKKDELLPYLGITTADGWHAVSRLGKQVWISGMYSAIVDQQPAEEAPSAPAEIRPYVPKGKIADISKWQTSVNWEKAAKELDFVILRCSYTTVKKDEMFEKHVAGCKKYGIPFGVYVYAEATTEAHAEAEAVFMWNVASKHDPLFYVYDAEVPGITRKTISAWTRKMRQLGAKKLGYYIAHHRFQAYNANVAEADFIWIPRYGKNDGKVGPKPAFKCDLHQFTSLGKLAGISGGVDLNRINGSKPITWFLERA